MTAPQLRDRYLQDSINTASPGKLLIMLYDRLVLDLMQAEEALRTAGAERGAERRTADELVRLSGERERAHERLTHAQDIIVELRASLDVEAWSGAPGLANLYSFLLTELIGANVARDADRVASCRTLIEPLRDAWHEAAVAAVTG